LRGKGFCEDRWKRWMGKIRVTLPRGSAIFPGAFGGAVFPGVERRAV